MLLPRPQILEHESRAKPPRVRVADGLEDEIAESRQGIALDRSMNHEPSLWRNRQGWPILEQRRQATVKRAVKRFRGKDL